MSDKFFDLTPVGPGRTVDDAIHTARSKEELAQAVRAVLAQLYGVPVCKVSQGDVSAAMERLKELER